MNLIVVSDLTLKEGLYFRHLTMLMKSNLNINVLIEAQKDQIDYYYNILKKKGYYDFVADMLSIDEREAGVRLDTQYNYPSTVIAQEITSQNVISLYLQIRALAIMEAELK
mgnify:CR=1 FL=1